MTSAATLSMVNFVSNRRLALIRLDRADTSLL